MTSVDRSHTRPDGGVSSGRLIRHTGIDRLYHWCMAAAVVTLLATGFLPVVGVKFGWVEPHWIAGSVLAVLVLVHIVRASFFQDIWAMVVVPTDVRDAWRELRHAFGRGGPAPGKPGKYELLQKLYHAGAALVVLSAIVTGGMMMVKIDTPFWKRNPYWLSDSTWGVVYVVHGFAALATLTLLMIHVYFAIRPEKLWMTRSMIVGWITRDEYTEHHDSARWTADPADSGRRS